MRTNKAYTLNVLEGRYYSTIDGVFQLDKEWLNESIKLLICNDSKLYTAVTANRRTPITSIVWKGFTELANIHLRDEYDNSYYASSQHLKAFIGEDYSVLAPTVEYLEAERADALSVA